MSQIKESAGQDHALTGGQHIEVGSPDFRHHRNPSFALRDRRVGKVDGGSLGAKPEFAGRDDRLLKISTMITQCIDGPDRVGLVSHRGIRRQSCLDHQSAGRFDTRRCGLEAGMVLPRQFVKGFQCRHAERTFGHSHRIGRYGVEIRIQTLEFLALRLRVELLAHRRDQVGRLSAG